VVDDDKFVWASTSLRRAGLNGEGLANLCYTAAVVLMRAADPQPVGELPDLQCETAKNKSPQQDPFTDRAEAVKAIAGVLFLSSHGPLTFLRRKGLTWTDLSLFR